MLTNDAAKRQVISWGFSTRTIRIVENGIKPPMSLMASRPSSERSRMSLVIRLHFAAHVLQLSKRYDVVRG